MVLMQYRDILEPLEAATKLLEGRPSSGRYGSLFNVIPVFEYLL